MKTTTSIFILCLTIPFLGFGQTIYRVDSGTGDVRNSFFGIGSGLSTTTGLHNVFVGYDSGQNSNSERNTFLGCYSGKLNTTGSNNVFLGYAAGYYTAGANDNTFVGDGSGFYNISGANNSFVGRFSGFYNLASNNTFFGENSGYENTTGDENTFIGQATGLENTTGKYNVFIGRAAGNQNSVGNENTFLGHFSGFNASGSGNVYIGKNSGYNAIGNNKLYIDNSATDTPLLYGDFDSDILTVNGNLGIGTTTPSFSLDVKGDARVIDRLYIETPDSNIKAGMNLNTSGQLFVGDVANDDVTTYIVGYGSDETANSIIKLADGEINFRNLANDVMTITNNVGIGTTTPDAKLTVKGQIHTQEVRVDLQGAVAPDYVFASDYKLITIKEIEDYIKINKHLPEIPSAKQMEMEGIKLKDMNLLLLKKIEELTLYTIKQQKEIEVQQSKNTTLEKRLNRLEQLLNNVTSSQD